MSKETSGNKAWQTLFSGVGDTIAGKAKFYDESLQNRAAKDAEAALTGTQPTALQPFQTTTEDADTPPEDATYGSDTLAAQPAIESTMNLTERLTRAKAEGAISETHYWNRMDAEVRRVKARYPAYADVIDSRVAGILGQTTANGLRRSQLTEIKEAAVASSDETKNWHTFIRSNLEYLPTDYFQRQSSGEGYSKLQTMDYVRHQQYQKAEVQKEKTAIELEKAEGSLNKDKGKTLAVKETQNYVNRIIDSSTGPYADFSKMISEAAKVGKDMSPQEEMALRGGFAEMRLKLQQGISKILTDKWANSDSSYMDVITEEKDIKDVEQLAMRRVDQIEQYLTNKEYGLLDQDINATKAMKNDTIRKVLESNDFFRKGYAMKETGMSDMWNFFLTKDDNLKIAGAKAMRDLMTMKSVDGTSKSVGQDAAEAKKVLQEAGIDTKGVTKSIIQQRIDILQKQETPLSVIQSTAKSFFGENNKEFIESFKPSEKMKVYSSMVSPEMTKRMVQLRDADPELWKQYKSWSVNTFGYLFKDMAASVQEGVDQRDLIDIEFDRNSNQFQVKANPNAKKNSLGVFEAMEFGYSSSVYGSVQDFNKQIKLLEPILKADNQKIDEELLTLFGGMGIDTLAPKQRTFFIKLRDAVSNVFSPEEANEIITGKPTDALSGSGKQKTSGKQSSLTYEKEYRYDDAETEDLGSGIDLASLTPDTSITPLLETIRQGEASGSYDLLYGEGDSQKLSGKTLNEVLSIQQKQQQAGADSTAAGAYQFLHSTLRGLKRELGLSGDEPFDANLQDRLAVALLKRRGLDRYKSGELTSSEFINRIAREWAALPTTRGKGHYDGDGLNKSNVKLGALQSLLPELD